MHDLGDGRFGTRERAAALRGLGWFAVEAEKPDPPQYVLAGVESVATGLDALHYACSYGVFAIFVQARVAPDEDGRAVPVGDGAHTFRLAQDLQLAALDAAAGGRLRAPGRLIVLDAEFGQHSWKWAGADEQVGGDGLAGALNWIAGLG
ncbi:MAG: hypothetical protein JWM85_1389 [Acidimicrobiaceae bacterium]|nr:hypothetical protein [Acidimicrobiaceae bacterium]